MDRRYDPLDDVDLGPDPYEEEEAARAAGLDTGGETFGARLRRHVFGFAGRLIDGERRATRWTKRVLVALVVTLFVYYVGGAIWVHEIDDDPAFAPLPAVAAEEGNSAAVAMAAALIEREVDENGWTANDPFFMPGAILDNKPNFQMGIVYALSRFSVEMADQIGRARGSSQVDPDLDRASGLLRYPGDRWYFDFSAGLAPQATADSQYREAARRLLAYNRRLAAGDAVFDARNDNLLGTLDRIAADLGSASALTADHLAASSGWFLDFKADDIYYANKGRLYGYYMLLDALGRDFETVIADSGLVTVWDRMLESLRIAATLQPWVVLNGAPDSQITPSHLASQGFYLLRARTQLREASSVLQN
ncbi:MAG: DUF2333 family protein [Azospirillaceae bacterium]